MTGLLITGLSRRFTVAGRAVEALRAVDLTVPAGKLVAIVGHSGCGKTTLLRQIAGLDRPDAGTLRFVAADGRERPRGRIGMVFQEPRLLPWKTVRANLLLALRRQCTGAEAEARVTEALAAVELSAFADAWPHQLSGGMAQRAAMARALCRDPDILLLDEPFGALDALTRSRLHDEFAALRLRRPLTTVLVTHDIAEAVRLADTVAIMVDGRIIRHEPIHAPHPRTPADPRLAAAGLRITDCILGRPPSSAAAADAFPSHHPSTEHHPCCVP